MPDEDELLTKITAAVTAAIEPLRAEVQMIGEELDDFREEVASAFVEIRGQVDRVNRRLDRMGRSRLNGS